MTAADPHEWVNGLLLLDGGGHSGQGGRQRSLLLAPGNLFLNCLQEVLMFYFNSQQFLHQAIFP